MANFFTADNHYFHTNILKYCPERGKLFQSLSEMDSFMIHQWNSVVKPNDTIYVVGDFVFGGKTQIGRAVSVLTGHKILIRGNHDKGTQRYLDAGFIHMYDELMIDLGGQQVLLNHFPYDTTDPRFQSRKPKDTGLWLLCGHAHDKWLRREKMINVGVDQWNFAPVNEHQILQLIHESVT